MPNCLGETPQKPFSQKYARTRSRWYDEERRANEETTLNAESRGRREEPWELANGDLNGVAADGLGGAGGTQPDELQRIVLRFQQAGGDDDEDRRLIAG